MVHLQIYVAHGCPMCVYSRQLAADIPQRFPMVDVRVIDIAELHVSELPDNVFATPTWLLNGRVYSMGNPDPEDLWDRLAMASQQAALKAKED